MFRPVFRNFRGLDDSAAEDGRAVVVAGGSKGVEGRDEERSFGPIAAGKGLELKRRLRDTRLARVEIHNCYTWQ